MIGGFDRRFDEGYCFDDDEFLLSIKYNLKLNLKIIPPDKYFVVHQYHTRDNISSEIRRKWLKNKNLYKEIKSNHEKYNFKYPKLLHLYWDGSPLSYLNYLTVLSFNKYNKDWKIIVYTPINRSIKISWKSREQKIKYTGRCYFDKLNDIHNVTIQTICLDTIGFDNSASEVIKSDYFRYYILQKHGGLWSDFDIMYTGSIEEKMNFREDSVMFRCIHPRLTYYPIGLLMCVPGSKIFKYILNQCKHNYDGDIYQSIGAAMINKLFRDVNNISKIDSSVKLCNKDYYLPWAWNQLDEFLSKKENTLPDNNVGIHWFNGADKSKQYAIKLEERLNNFAIECYLDKFVNEYIDNNNYNKTKISIVMAYYNRKEQVIQTLDGFEKNYTKKYNFEVIIVDDNSKDDQQLNDIIDNYSFDINLIIIIQEEKGDRLNPCTAYNKGFSKAKGNIIIIQNPECYHVGDIIGYTLENLKEQDYFSYSCYTANTKEITQELLNSTEVFSLVNDYTFRIKNVTSNCELNWYNHPTETNRNVAYHYCSAIYKSKLDLIGGFDNRFAEGYCFDDDEFLLTIKHNLKLNIKIIDPNICFVIHQYHRRNASCNIEGESDSHPTKRKWMKNKNLYEQMKLSHEQYNFKFPKLLHLYWDMSPMSYLNYLTVLSFNKHNKNWKIIIYSPTNKSDNITWKTGEHSEKYTGKCYFNKLNDVDNVSIQKICLDKIGFDSNVPEVIKSDYFRYYILHKHGGLWSDFDILYTGNIEEKMNFNKNTVIFHCKTTSSYCYYPVGLFLTIPNAKFFKHILNLCSNVKHLCDYQILGSQLFDVNHESILNSDDSIKICNNDYYLPWQWNELEDLLTNKNNNLPSNNVGIHWFNGGNLMKKYNNNLSRNITKFEKSSYFKSLVGEYIKENNYEILSDEKIILINIIKNIDVTLSSHSLYQHNIINKMSNVNISIVMTSSDRSTQTYFTLKTIDDQAYNKNVQVILVDDSKNDPIEIYKLNGYHNIQINIIKINIDTKKWVNPVVNYNIGFKFIKGDKVVIQNAEVCHVGNTIDFIDNACMDNTYYLLDVKKSPSYKINKKIYENSILLKNNTDIFRNENIFTNNSNDSWYQNSEKRNYMMHFLSFMNSKTFSKIKEFSYDYCYGTDYDDNDWLLSIVSNRINLTPIDNNEYNIGGIHLCHHKNNLSDKIHLVNKEIYIQKLIAYNNFKLYVDFTHSRNTEYVKSNNNDFNYNLEVEQTQLFYKNISDQIISFNKIDDNIIKLSILVPTVPSRLNYFFPKIMNHLNEQINIRKDIELIALYDNKKRTIGTKRQEMINISQGEYITFIDDDDRIENNYIDEIMNCLYANKNVDCVVYNVICCVNNNKNKKLCKYGIEYEYGNIKNGLEWRGKPSHTMIWKSNIVKNHKYSDMGHGEDTDWVTRAWKDIKTQVRIDKVLYYYDANYSSTSETSNLSDYIININITKLMEQSK